MFVTESLVTDKTQKVKYLSERDDIVFTLSASLCIRRDPAAAADSHGWSPSDAHRGTLGNVVYHRVTHQHGCKPTLTVTVLIITFYDIKKALAKNLNTETLYN